jgi:CRISPR-associated protein Cmr3
MFFGRGLPFAAGESDSSAGVPLPPPSVACGALRSAFFSEHPDELPLATGNATQNTEANDTPEARKDMCLTHWSLYSASDQESLFPAPLDFALNEDNQLELLRLETNSDGLCSVPGNLPYRLRVEKIEKKPNAPTGCWVRYLADYLQGKTPCLWKAEDVFLPEPKIGLTRDTATKTAQQGMLYQLPMLRFKENIRFALSYENLAFVPSMLRLGGQTRVCTAEKTSASFAIQPGDISNGCFKLYVATPAIFSDGWRPEFLQDGKYELCAACVGNAVPISGWGMKARRPKPLCLTVPAGSVYYLKLTENTAQARNEVIERFHGKAISSKLLDKRQGFGIVYVGGWNA